MQRPGHNFRRGCAETIDENNQRAVIKFRGIIIFIHDDTAVWKAGEHNRAVCDEQAGEMNGFFKRATAVVPQVNDNARDFFLLEFVDQL